MECTKISSNEFEISEFKWSIISKRISELNFVSNIYFAFIEPKAKIIDFHLFTMLNDSLIYWCSMNTLLSNLDFLCIEWMFALDIFHSSANK